jgi:hypothetical protein
MFWRRQFQSGSFAAAVFLLSLVFFTERGPYCALRDGRSGDFATIYAAARCWLKHENPYAREDLTLELQRGGAPASLIREQDQHVSAYPISVMPLAAVFAWLPWRAANLTWCLFSLVCFAASVRVLLKDFGSLKTKLLAAGCCLFFSPTYVGVLNGNPSVVAISLVMLAVHFAGTNWRVLSGILFAIILCMKPQIPLLGLLAFLLWKCWAPLFIGLAGASSVLLFATAWVSSFGQNWQWWESLKQNTASLALPGGLIDPRPASPYADGFLNAQTLSYLFTANAALAEGLVLISSAGFTALYFQLRKTDKTADRRIDSAFLAAITLMTVYHRYYDGQLLLLAIPAVALFWERGRGRTAWALGLCLTMVAFPLQSFFAKQFAPAAAHLSLFQVLLFRHEPAAVLAMALILSLSSLAVRKDQTGHTEIETAGRAVRDDPKLPRYVPRLRLP